jgi:hypothetical protein
VKRHFNSVSREIAETAPLQLGEICPPMIVLPMDRWSKIAEKGMRFAISLSGDIKAVHVQNSEGTDDLSKDWSTLVEEPAKAAGRAVPELVILNSPFRFVVTPLVDYVLELSEKNPDRAILVLIPELVEKRWYHYFLHNQRAQALKALLLVRGNQRVMTMNVPWYLEE